MSPPSRRDALHLLAAGAVPLSGCPASPVPPTTSTERVPTLDFGETHEFPDGTTATVRDVRVERLIRSYSVGSPTHVDVAWLPDHQFAVVEADVAPSDDPRELEPRFALDVDGTRHPRGDRRRYRALPPGSHKRPGLPALPVPVAEASVASVVRLRDGEPAARWPLPPGTVDDLGGAPAFVVRSLDVPESIRRGRHFDASFTVANTGGRTGRFLAEFGVGAISDHGEVATTVPAGGGRTYTASLDPYAVGDVDETTVTLDWGRERLERRVTVTD